MARPSARLSFVTLALLCVAAAVGATASSQPRAAAAVDPVIAAAGDIACDPTLSDPDPSGGTPSVCQYRATSDLLMAQPLAAVLGLGDLQYAGGSLSAFTSAYGPTWGRVKPVTRPAIGNHEYLTTGAAGYFDYFGSAAGARGSGWYSSDVGAWHLIALNANCDQVGCAAGSPQERWLRDDLAAHPAACTLAYFHQPRFTSSPRGSDPGLTPLWQALHDGGTDVVLNGHEHNYERFALQDPAGRADPTGIREFIVGTGGRGLSPYGPAIANSEVRSTAGFGVLLMTLHPSGYDWRFAAIGGTDVDSGTTACTNDRGTRAASPSPAPSSPAAQAPASQAPASQAPASQAPTSQAPSGPAATQAAPTPAAPAPTTPAPAPSPSRATSPTSLPPAPAPASAAPTPPAPRAPATTPAAPRPPAPTTPVPAAPAPAECRTPLVRTAARQSVSGTPVRVQVSGAAGRSLDLLAASAGAPPRTIRTALLDGSGTASFTIRPSTTTQLSAQEHGCPAGPAVTLPVRTAVTLSATRTGTGRYRFAGNTSPARAGRTVDLVGVQASGRRVLVARAVTSADGRWTVDRTFLRAGLLALTAVTPADAANAAGASAVRATVVR